MSILAGNTRESIEKTQSISSASKNTPPDTEEAEAKQIPEEGGYRHQCYLLDSLEDIREYFKNQGVIPLNDRLMMVSDSESLLFYNYLTCPDFNEHNIFETNKKWVNSVDVAFNLLKNNNKIDVYKSLIQNDSSVKARMKSIKLDYNGTNPASARADIKVVVTIQLNGTLKQLDEEITYDGKKFKLVDLITRPEFFSPNQAGLARHRKSQYSPEHNAVELVITSDFRNYSPETNETTTVGDSGNADDKTGRSSMATQTSAESNKVTIKTNNNPGFAHTITYPLAMVDHELSYKIDKSANIDLTITYNSYIDVQLNMPFMDALAGYGGNNYQEDNEVLKGKPYGLVGRKKRDDELSEIIVDDKSKEEIKEKREENRKLNEADVDVAYTRINKALYDKKLAWVNLYEEGDKYITVPTTQRGFKGWSKTINNEQSVYKNVSNAKGSDRGVTFFFLADIVGVLSDLFYEDSYYQATSKYNKVFKDKLQPKFIFMDITLPNEDTYNLGEIPISSKFFESYMEENYIKEKIAVAPIMNFLRNFIEKAVTKAINETCFVGEGEGWKGRIEVKSFRAKKQAWTNLLAKRSYWYSPDESAQKVATTSLRDSFRGNFGDKISPQSDYYEYLMIYPSAKTNSRTILDNLFDQEDESTQRQRALKYVPVISDMDYPNAGEDVTSDQILAKGEAPRGNYLGTKLSFKRTDMKYRREAVYSSYQTDQFLAVGNVYNCTINSSKACFNWFFPGHLVIAKPYAGQAYNFWDKDAMVTKLGLTGAYLLTKVSISLELPVEGTGGIKKSTQMEGMWETSGLSGLIKEKEDTQTEENVSKPPTKQNNNNQNATPASQNTTLFPEVSDEVLEELVGAVEVVEESVEKTINFTEIVGTVVKAKIEGEDVGDAIDKKIDEMYSEEFPEAFNESSEEGSGDTGGQ